MRVLTAHELRRRTRRPTRGQYVVDDDHARLFGERALVHLQLGDAVLRLHADAVALGRQLARLARRDEARVEARCQRAAEDEAARLDADDGVDVLADVPLRDRVEHDVKRTRIGEQRGDVLEQDPGGGEVGDVADE